LSAAPSRGTAPKSRRRSRGSGDVLPRGSVLGARSAARGVEVPPGGASSGGGDDDDGAGAAIRTAPACARVKAVTATAILLPSGTWAAVGITWAARFSPLCLSGLSFDVTWVGGAASPAG
jgi:hypothetical protein